MTSSSPTEGCAPWLVSPSFHSALGPSCRLAAPGEGLWHGASAVGVPSLEVALALGLGRWSWERPGGQGRQSPNLHT